MAEALQSNVTPEGVNQGDLVRVLANLRDVVNELQADHGVFVTLTTELNTDADAVFADLTALRAAVVAITAKLDADAGVTDTNYAATCNPAALTATAIAAANVSALTNSTAITLIKG